MNPSPSQTSQEISIAYLSYINDHLREEVERRTTATNHSQNHHWYTRIASAASTAILGCLWIFRN